MNETPEQKRLSQLRTVILKVMMWVKLMDFSATDSDLIRAYILSKAKLESGACACDEELAHDAYVRVCRCLSYEGDHIATASELAVAERKLPLAA